MRKVLKYSLVFILILCGLILILPSSILVFLNSTVAATIIQNAINENIPGSLSWEKHHISLLRGKITIYKAACKDANEYEIAGFDKFYIDISIPALLQKHIRIDNCILDKPWVDLQIDSVSGVNLVTAFVDQSKRDTAKEREASAPFPFSITVKKLALQHGSVQGSVNTDAFVFDVGDIVLSAQAQLPLNRGGIDSTEAIASITLKDAMLKSPSFVSKITELSVAANLLNAVLDTVTVSLKTPASNLVIAGHIKDLFSKPDFSLRCTNAISLEEIRHVFRMQQKLSGIASIQIVFDGPLSNPVIAVAGNFTGGRVYDIPVTAIRTSLHADNSVIRLDTLTIHAPSTFVAGSASMDLSEATAAGIFSAWKIEKLGYALSINATSDALGKLLPSMKKIKGGVNATVAIAGKSALPESMDAQASLRVDTKRFSFNTMQPVTGTIAAEVDAADGVLYLKQSAGTALGSTFNCTGTYNVKTEECDAALSIDTLELSSLLAIFSVDSISGRVTAGATAAGKVSHPNLTCKLGGRDVTAYGYKADRIVTEASLDSSGIITVPYCAIEHAHSGLKISGSSHLFKKNSFALLENPFITCTIDSSSIFLQDFFDSLSGRCILYADVQTRLDSGTGVLLCRGDNLDFGIQTIPQFELSARLDGNRVVIRPLKVAIDANEAIYCNGWVSLDKQYQLSLQSDKISLKSIKKVKEMKGMDGTLILRANGSGSLKAPEVNAVCDIVNLQAMNKPVDDIHIEIGVHDTVVTLNSTSDFEIIGTLALPSKEFQVAARFDKTELSPYFMLADQKDFSGAITGTITAAGYASSVDSIMVKTQLRKLRILYGDSVFLVTKDVQWQYQNKQINIPATYFTLLHLGKCTVQGQGDLDKSFDLQIRGSLPLAIVSAFTTDVVNPSGMVLLSADITGTVKEPVVWGTIRLDSLRCILPATAQELHDIYGSARVTNDALSVDSINGMLDDGSFNVQSIINLEKYKPVTASGSITARGLPIVVPETMDMHINADLTAKHGSDKSTINGEIVLLDGTYYKDIKLKLFEGVGKKKRETKPVKVDTTASFLETIGCDVALKRRDYFIVDNNLAYLEVNPDLQLTGNLGNPVISGRATIPSGTVNYRRKVFTVTRGVIDFLNPYVIEPTLDLKSETVVRDWKIILAISGTPEELLFTLSSEPNEEDGDILSLLLVGKTTAELSQGKIDKTQSTEQLLTNVLGTFVEKEVKGRTGLDEFKVETGETEKGSDRVKVTLGKNLSQRLATRYSIESEGREIIQKAILEYKVFENLLLRTFNDNRGNAGGEAQVQIEFR